MKNNKTALDLVFSALVSPTPFPRSPRKMVEILHNENKFSTKKLIELFGENTGETLSVRCLIEIINHVSFTTNKEREKHVLWAEGLLPEILGMHPYHEIHMAETEFIEYLFNEGRTLENIKEKIFTNQLKTPV